MKTLEQIVQEKNEELSLLYGLIQAITDLIKKVEELEDKLNK